MKIVIPLEGLVRMLISSSFVLAQRTDAVHYNLSGDAFNLSSVTKDQVYILPDEVEINEGAELTDDVLMKALPFEQFIRVTAEEALPAACCCRWQAHRCRTSQHPACAGGSPLAAWPRGEGR